MSVNYSYLNKLVDYLKLYEKWGVSVIPLFPRTKIPCVEHNAFHEQGVPKSMIKKWLKTYWNPEFWHKLWYKFDELDEWEVKVRAKWIAALEQEYKKYQLEELNPENFRYNGELGLAVLGGKASNGLVLVDIEDASKVAVNPRAFFEYFGTTVVKTGKEHGYHLWFRCKDFDENIDGANGEIRCTGKYVVAPPSVHPTGAEYTFVFRNPPDEISKSFIKEEVKKWIGVEQDKRESKIGEKKAHKSTLIEALKKIEPRVGIRSPWTFVATYYYKLKGHSPEDAFQELLEIPVCRSKILREGKWDEERGYEWWLKYEWNDIENPTYLGFLAAIREAERETGIELDISDTELKEDLKKRGKITISDIVDYLVDSALKNFTIKTFAVKNSVIGIHIFNSHVWEEGELTLNRWLVNIYNEIKKEFNSIPSYTYTKREFMERLKDLTLEELDYDPLSIAFKNVYLDWGKFLHENKPLSESVEKPNAERVVFHQINYNLIIEDLIIENINDIENAAKKFCPKALKAFKDWVGDKWILLFEIIGYCLYPKYDMHKAVMLVGDGRNGKSTYLSLVKKILGRKNTTSVKLQDLIKEKFAVAQLYHKLANIFADLPSEAIEDTGVFKILTGEDEITADRKFRDPITFVNYAKLLFSANELPKVSDMTLAFWRRWLVVEFPNKFEINPKFFEETFTEEEIEGVILVAVHAFKQVWMRKKFSFEETEADYKEVWLKMTNPVYAFIKDSIENGILIEEKDAEVSMTDLYKLYVSYCQNEGRRVVPKNIFSMELERLGYRGKRIRGYKYFEGLRIARDEDTEFDLSQLL